MSASAICRPKCHRLNASVWWLVRPPMLSLKMSGGCTALGISVLCFPGSLASATHQLNISHYHAITLALLPGPTARQKKGKMSWKETGPFWCHAHVDLAQRARHEGTKQANMNSLSQTTDCGSQPQGARKTTYVKRFSARVHVNHR